MPRAPGVGQDKQRARRWPIRKNICILEIGVGMPRREKRQFSVHKAPPEPHLGVPSMPNQT
eukprot:1138272-Pelagomonas_calceolata.AAC.11